MVKYLVDAETDILLVKVEGSFNASKAGEVNEAEIHMSFQMTASEVTYLPPDETIKGVVSDLPDKYRIYEFYVNSMQFPSTDLLTQSAGVDLFVQLTPCTGHLKFYMSDSFSNLFHSKNDLGLEEE